MKKFQLYIFCIGVTLLLGSCNYGIYAPTSKRCYTPHEEKQILAAMSSNLAPSFISLSADVSYSPVKNLGLQGFFDISQNYQSAGLGLGLYHAKYSWTDDYLKKGFHFDAYLGYSIHKAQKENARVFIFGDDFSYKASYQDLSLNLGFHFNYNYVGFDVIYRPHLIDIYRVRLKGDVSSDTVNSYERLSRRPFVVNDIIGQLNIGNHDVQFFGAINISAYHGDYVELIDPVSVSCGMNINVENLLNGTLKFF